MKKLLITSMVALTIGLNGCASIITGSSQTLTFTSVPESATIEIKNRNGVKVHTGQTPATVSLKKGAGYFKPESYQVSFSKPGYQTKTVEVTGTLSGWQLGNIIFGGLIQVFVVFGIHGLIMTTIMTNVFSGIPDPITGLIGFASHAFTAMALAVAIRTRNKKTKSLAIPLLFQAIYKGQNSVWAS